MFLNFIEFQYRVLKDFNLTILSIIFIITIFSGLSIIILKDFRFYYYLILLIFNIINYKNNFYKYQSLFQTNQITSNYICNNRKYLIINDLLFTGYLYINFYYFNLIQICLFILTFISLLRSLLRRKTNRINIEDIEMSNIGIEPVIEYYINQKGRKVLRFEDDGI